MRWIWLGALVLAAMAALGGAARADLCQPCEGEEVEDPKMHGRSLKSYWGVAHATRPPDQEVLEKAWLQGHLALCGTPDQWEWNMFMGMLAAEMKKYKEAGCYFQQAIKNSEGKDRDKVLNNRGSFWVQHYNQSLDYFKKEAFQPAVDEADIAILVAPDSCKAYNVKGSALSSLGRQDEAIPVLRAGLEQCPDHEALVVNLFNAYRDQGDQLYREATKAEGDSARTQLLLEAIGRYEEADRIQPGDPNIDYQIGSACAQLVLAGDTTRLAPARARLVAFLDKVEAKQDRLAVLYQLAVIEIEAKDFTAASAYADRLIGVDPRDADGYRLKANIIRQLGDPAQAESYIIIYNTLSRGRVLKADSLKATRTYAGSDLKKVLADKGQPDEFRSYKDSSGNNMDTAFYWTKGVGVTFYDGQKRGEITFPPSP